jgi:hypothetical protein
MSRARVNLKASFQLREAAALTCILFQGVTGGECKLRATPPPTTLAMLLTAVTAVPAGYSLPRRP